MRNLKDKVQDLIEKYEKEDSDESRVFVSELKKSLQLEQDDIDEIIDRDGVAYFTLEVELPGDGEKYTPEELYGHEYNTINALREFKRECGDKTFSSFFGDWIAEPMLTITPYVKYRGVFYASLRHVITI